MLRPSSGWSSRPPRRFPLMALDAPSLPFDPLAGSSTAIVGCLELFPRYGEHMSKVKKLLHTRYRVDDLERTVKFYREVLGLEEVKRHKSPRGSELVFLKAPGSEELIEITFFPAGGSVQVQPDLTHLAFEVDSLAEFQQHLAKHGL